ncbi:hypothetical protein C1645_827379 [Glomus cerebriforme]|uniref:Uncharacterized protein n=1 Tax=Glomus cerebriforme TaxID=658196 RepID=A0A397ST10_9GLOM|nr:hypothetical protein C1645_827379 [Glomus cerebriforme]
MALISTYVGEFVNTFRSLVDNRTLNNYIVESDDELHESDLAYLYGVLDKTKELLEESCNKPKGHLWLKIWPNFKLLDEPTILLFLWIMMMFFQESPSG